MVKNILFDYLYRDGDNYKNGGAVIFANPAALTCEQIDARLRDALEDGEYFIASQVGVPELFLWSEEAEYDPEDESTFPSDLGPGAYVINETDHCWHEYFGVEETELPPTDSRTINDFVSDVENMAGGWEDFIPEKKRKIDG